MSSVKNHGFWIVKRFIFCGFIVYYRTLHPNLHDKDSFRSEIAKKMWNNALGDYPESIVLLISNIYVVMFNTDFVKQTSNKYFLIATTKQSEHFQQNTSIAFLNPCYC